MRTTYLAAAEVATDLLDHHALTSAWGRDSALEGMTVGGLAAHLARAVLTVDGYLQGEAPAPDASTVDAPGYLLAALPDPSRDSDVNQSVLGRAEDAAAAGPATVRAECVRALDRLRQRLPQEPRQRLLAVLGGIAIGLDDYLATRLVELTVHLDDLAASVPDLSLPDLPPGAEATAIGVLAELARRRSSTSAMVALLARRERLGAQPPHAL